MRRILSICAVLLVSAIPAANAGSKDSSIFDGITHRITAEVRPVHNMATHGFYRGYNDFNEPIPAGGSIHLKYGFSLDKESRLARLYPSTYQGIGISVNSFFHHNITGTPVALYIFQGSRIADLTEKLSIDYEWNLGASYGWKVNEVVGSKCNIYINVGIPFTWHISPEWDLSIGPEYTHFSNGDTRFPNGGANTVGLRVGVTGILNGDTAKNYQVKAPGKLMVGKEEILKDRTFAQRMSYDICIYGAWRADRISEGVKLHLINKAFPTGGVSFNPLYRLNRYFSAGAGLDMLLDRSADIYNPDDIRYPPIYKQMACGLSLRGELTMPFFSINLGAGYNMSAGDDLKGFYTSYALKCFISEKLFLNIGYRLSSVLYSHNLLFGFGIRL